MASKEKSKKIKRIYWDTAAGTSVDKRVLKAMAGNWDNPASIHREGVEANKAVEEAREKIAKVLFAHADEIIFTGSGTESDNLAILGVAKLATKKHIITTAIEHKAVLEPCRYLQKKGYKVTYLKVDKNGVIDLKELKESLTKNTFLVSVMMANNEIGTIQPIKEVAKILRQFKKANNINTQTGQASRPYFHVDACQAPRFLDLNVEKLGVDLMSFNGSKIYGPKGVGVLYVRRGVLLAPIIMGGGQERGLRSGTLNVAGIVGLASALEICAKEREKESSRLFKLQSKLMGELSKIPDLVINGPDVTRESAVLRDRFSCNEMGSRKTGSSSDVRKTTWLREVAFLTLLSRLPNNVNFSIAGFEGEQLVLELDAKGFAVSSGSACSYDSGEGSYAIRAIDGNEARATGAVRISFGREVEMADIKKFTKELKLIVDKYKNFIN